MNKTNNKTKKVRIRQDLHHSAKVAAYQNGITLLELVNQAVERRLKDYYGKK